MPRIYNTDRDPLDYCRECYPEKKAAEIAALGDEADYDAPHPAYEFESYDCDCCKKPLSGKDN